jgi:hypothetical protein
MATVIYTKAHNHKRLITSVMKNETNVFCFVTMGSGLQLTVAPMTQTYAILNCYLQQHPVVKHTAVAAVGTYTLFHN